MATAEVDYALFSLSPDSGSLSVYGLEASEVFFTQYDGRFWRYASADDLGLLSGVGRENVDALEVIIAGDANVDGMVDYQDLGILATNYDKTGMDWEQGDFTSDGRVGYEDLGLLATFYDVGTKSGSPVPEPAALALLALGGLAVARRRPRRRQ